MRLSCRDLSWNVVAEAAIVTPNRFYAEVVAAQFTRAQLRSGAQSWQRPTVTSVEAWLAGVWQNVRYTGVQIPNLLSLAQENALWRRLFEEAHPDLFDVAAAARLAIEATRVLAEWNISLEGDAWEEYKDASQFRVLYRQFRRECRERDCITRSDLWRLVPEWLQHETGHVAFAGVATWSPGLIRIREALGDRASVYPLASSKKQKRWWTKPFDSVGQEFEYAARWARHQLESRNDVSIGIFVPSLNDQRAAVAHAFDAVFYPGRAATLDDPRQVELSSAGSAFHISGAVSLMSHPIVACALLLLKLPHGIIPTTDASAILRSPFLAGAEAERALRARADLELRKNRDIQVTLGQMEYRTATCSLLTPVWQGLRRAMRTQPRTASLAGWSEWITEFLKAAGWPGDLSLRPEEARVLEVWQDALSQLSSLTYVFAPVSYEKALSELRGVLSRSAAPERGDWLSPVQIVDADTAAGLEFDTAAAIGFSEDAWPPRDKPQAFIPLRLRRQAGVPGSTPESATELRARQAQLLFGAAPEMIVTYTGALAPLAKPFVRTNAAEPAVWAGELPSQSFAAAVLERVEDETGPPLSAGAPLSGGVSLIKSQSQCPFQAFARYRLLAETPEDACFGLDARERGSYLHKALEYAWRQLESSDRLRATSEEELREIARSAVAEAVRDDQSSPFHQLVSETERNRLSDVLVEWLEFEKGRKVPFRVEHIEDKRSIQLGGLELNVRVDRIDRLADGSVLLVDYKSGQPALKDLLGERPKEPQLLVYASAMEDEVDGVYLAQVRAREMKAVGMGNREHFPLPRRGRAAADWESQSTGLREKVQTIAQEFVSGRAAVDPQPGVCGYCGSKLICRVAELDAAGEENGDE